MSGLILADFTFMDRYKKYTVDDFLADDGFLRWVLSPSDEDDRFWKKFLDEHPGKRKDIEEARLLCSIFQVKQKKLSLDETFEIWNNVLQTGGRQRSSRWLSMLKYAAVFLLLFVSGALAYHWYDRQEHQSHFELAGEVPPAGDEARIILADGSEVSLEKKESLINYSSSGDQLVVNNDTIRQKKSPHNEAVNKVIIPYGKKSVIRLSDGTTVWLNAGSQLVYPSVFMREKREVFLIGEAYFDVAENRSRPFVVKTAGVAVTVLGTKFDVSAYPEDKYVETVLESGSVSLEITGNSFLNMNRKIVLRPNQKGSFDRQEGVVDLTEVDVSRYTSWKDGMLKVEKEDLNRVLKKVERYYNIHIELRDPLAGGYLISGKLDLKGSPEEVLNIIGLTVPIDWAKKSNGDFIIVKK